NLNYKKYVIVQEIYKLLMKQSPSLKELHFCSSTILSIPNTTTFTLYPGAKDCLANLSKLSCRTDIYSEFFYQLSQICHNIQSLKIKFEDVISNWLEDLIYVQKNLRCLEIIESLDNSAHIFSALTTHSNTINKLYLDNFYQSLSFIAKFTNLQELVFSMDVDYFEDFDELQNVIFPQLQILKFTCDYP